MKDKLKELVLLLLSMITVELTMITIGVALITIGAHMIYSPAGYITCGFLMLKLAWPDEGGD